MGDCYGGKTEVWFVTKTSVLSSENHQPIKTILPQQFPKKSILCIVFSKKLSGCNLKN